MKTLDSVQPLYGRILTLTVLSSYPGITMVLGRCNNFHLIAVSPSLLHPQHHGCIYATSEMKQNTQGHKQMISNQKAMWTVTPLESTDPPHRKSCYGHERSGCKTLREESKEN